jgi:hypothetical protein
VCLPVRRRPKRVALLKYRGDDGTARQANASAPAELRDNSGIHIDGQDVEAVRFQQIAYHLPDPPVPYDDDMALISMRRSRKLEIVLPALLQLGRKSAGS